MVPHARWLILALAIAALPTRPAHAQGPDGKQLAAQARTVLKSYCYRCHHGPGSEGGDFDALKVVTLTAKHEDGEPPYVIPGKAAASYLFKRMALRKGGKGDMPPTKVAERPTDTDKAIIKLWIEAGAPPFPTEVRAYVDTRKVLAAIRDDLNRTDPARRPFLRFFTLAHLHNNPRVLDDDLRVYRAALSKAINSLSWKPGIVVPRAIDNEQTVFAVDVRALDWDRGDLWLEILKAYPYGLRYQTDPGLQQLDRDVAALSHCELAYVRGDWFAATATRPPLYHQFLQLPRYAGQLENKLGVDVRLNFDNDKLVRGGFARSGVSGQNRLVERHQGNYGAYWKSYDFKAGNARNDLKQFPLGPLNLFPDKKHPYPDQAFVHDGGEIIFSLPNRLHGFLLINGKDERIDQGPEDVVNDPLKTSGTTAIVSGQSCMACHKHGMIPFTDLLRDGAAVFGAAQEKVRRLYPDGSVMRRFLQEDEQDYLGALERAVGPFLRVGKDAAKPLKAQDEPIAAVCRLYRLEGLDLKMVACELDVREPMDLERTVGAARLRELGLAVLLQAGGVINRAEWDTLRTRSLMQRVAVELGATPLRIGD